LLPVVAVDAAALEIVQAYLRHRVMPADPLGDALHLALASYHRCDFLVTWNCKHLANANKFGHIRRVNALLDYTTLLSSRRSNSWEQPMTDPAIDAIRQARHQISRAYDHDAARLIEHYKQMQDAFAGRIIQGPEAAEAAQQGVEPDGPVPSPSVGRRSAG
jgi:hypothetical protein